MASIAHVITHHAAFAQVVGVMKSGRHRHHGPVVMRITRGKPRARRSPGEELLGAGALEVPLPGSLLVLVSRLFRSEAKTRPGGRTSAR